MNRTHTTATTFLAAALALAGCGTATTSLPAETPVVTATLEPTATAEPSAPASADAASSPSQPSSVADLEELIPDEVAGLTMEKIIFSGEELAVGTGTPEGIALFENLGGISAESFGMAYGHGVGPTGENVEVHVFRDARVDSLHVLEIMRDTVYGSSENPPDFSEETIGGKNVVAASDPGQSFIQTVYLYATGDLLFVVTAEGPDTTLAQQALAALP